MKFTIMPSLEHIALVRIVATLWMQKDVRDLISNFSVPVWQTIEKKVIRKVPQLPVPDLLKKKIISLIKPIGSQILKWINYHCRDIYLRMDLPTDFCWSPQGTIDGKKTAGVLIKDGNLDIIKRYKLACIYCLKNDISELWNNIPECRQEILSFEDTSDIIQHFIWLYWTHIMQVGYCDPFYPSQYVVESCAKDGNKAATEYYLEELTPMEREESLVKAAQESENVEVLCFLLSQMDDEQQKKVFESNPYKVLLCFLDWPMENLFTEVADRMWDFLSEREFDRLLKVIMVNIRDFSKDSNYENLFESFWQKSPSTFKRYVVSECSSSRYLLPYLLQIKDEDKIKFLLQDATLVEKMELVYCNKMQICRDLISNGDWDFLRFFIQECLPSKNEVTTFKKEFERHVVSRPLKDFTRSKQKWDQLFFPSDVPVRKSNKRVCTEEVESQPSKKSRCTQQYTMQINSSKSDDNRKDNGKL